ncbi:MAG: hypothetical protein V4722_04945 [Bacteroidota bacterium]
MKTVLNFKALLVLPLLALVFASCSDYGKKVKCDGTKGEVYYKGEGVTESDGQKLCSYLKEIGYFDSVYKSVQLLKAKDGGYDVRFVVDEKKLKEAASAEDGFVAIGALISKNVFASQPVNIFLADDKMKDIKSLPYNKKKAEDLLAADEPKTDDTPTASKTGALSEYDKHVSDGITFYWKDPVTDAEAEEIGKAVINTGDFKGGTAETTNIIIDKSGDRYMVKYPVADAYIDLESTATALEGIAKKLKDAAFANVPFSFIMIDTKMSPVKSWDY